MNAFGRILGVAVLLGVVMLQGCVIVYPSNGGDTQVDAYLKSGEEREPAELKRCIVIPIYQQDRFYAIALEPPIYDILEPVVLTGNPKRFDFPKRTFSLIFLGPMTAFRLGSGTFPSEDAFVFAEGCWPAFASSTSSCGLAEIEHSPCNEKTPEKDTIIFNFVIKTRVPANPTLPTLMIHAPLFPLKREYDDKIQWNAGLNHEDACYIFEKHYTRLFEVIDKSALAKQDRIMIYQQLTKLAEGALENGDEGKRKLFKPLLPIFQAKAKSQ